MKINRNSWHYRWFKFLFEKMGGSDFKYHEPKTLCAYFWRFVGNNVKALAFILAVLGIISSLPFSLYEWWRWHSAMALDFLRFLMWMVLGVAAVFGVVGICVVLFGVLPEKVAEKVKCGEELSGAELVVAYVQARKRKVCPILEYEYNK